VLGGKAIDGPGYFWEPTVITDLDTENCRIMNEEPFGPVAPIVSFDTTDEALALANRVPFGFASYVFTSSLATARITGEPGAGKTRTNIGTTVGGNQT
jgi:succinate-semialdehyde dehydrogenase / glutarate-semialdehyde dehydrogenase